MPILSFQNFHPYGENAYYIMIMPAVKHVARLLRETLIKAPVRVCAVILPKLFVENTRFTISKAVLFASILGKIPIATSHRFFNQRFLGYSIVI